MAKYKNVALLFIIIFSLGVQAQDDLQNMKKYWWYRHRLLNDFLIKGDFQGGSIPLNQRAYGLTAPPVAYWGDGSIALSQYIAVLATEFKLLEQEGQPTDSTLEELFYAIKAFNRLDEIGEINSVFPTHTIPVPADINGYFIRDDIPANFLTNPAHAKLAQGRVTGRFVSNVLSDFISSNPTDKEMSHDQVWHIYTSLALVRKYLYSGINFQGKELNDKTHNIDIWQEAEDIADRILTRIKNDSWVVTNPNTGAGVARGPFVQELSYGAAEAACYIKNVNTNLDPGFPVHTCTDYHDFISYLDANAWMDFGHGYGTLLAFSAEDFKVQTLAALGNSWWTRSNPFLPDPITVLTILFDPTNFLHPFTTLVSLVVATVPIPPVNVTTAELGIRATLRDYQHLSLLRQVLHGGSNPIPNNLYKNLLDSAPACGPHNYGYPSSSSSFEWSTDSRLLYPNRRGEDGSGTDKVAPFYGEYNGLDYMLYYNLYHLIIPSSVPTVNFMDRRITNTFPYSVSSPVVGMPPTIIGNPTTPIEISGFNSVTASNILNSDASVSYRGGYEVILKPGFIATAGADFRAYVDPFDCTDDGEYRNSITNSNTNYTQIYNGQTTFINYPTHEEYTETESGVAIINEAGFENNSQVINSSIVSGLTSDSYLSVIPNPNNGIFSISLYQNNKLSSYKQLQVINMLGNTLLSLDKSSNYATTIDISRCPQGVYYIRCTTETGDIKIEKIIKN